MAAMGSHDVHAERRHTVYLCDGCSTAFEDVADAYDCEESHEGA